MKNVINVKIANIDCLPPEAMEELKEFQKKFNEKYGGCSITETLKYELNYDVHLFEKYLKVKYNCPKLRCKLNSELGFHEEWWTLKELCEVYKKYYPKSYIKKERYTKREVNEMLADLLISDVISAYSPIYQYSHSDNPHEIYDKNIRVKCRYFLDD